MVAFVEAHGWKAKKQMVASLEKTFIGSMSGVKLLNIKHENRQM